MLIVHFSRRFWTFLVVSSPELVTCSAFGMPTTNGLIQNAETCGWHDTKKKHNDPEPRTKLGLIKDHQNFAVIHDHHFCLQKFYSSVGEHSRPEGQNGANKG
jgi:hypothetical protein